MKEQIARYVVSLYRDIPTAIYEGLLLVLFLGIIFIIAFRLKQAWRKMGWLVLVEYVFVIICSTVIFRTTVAGSGHEFKPLWSYEAIHDGRSELLVENIMNVVAFAPVGLLLGCSFRSMRWWKALLIGSGISVSIEALQYFFHRGFAETDDVMHNTLGCILGYMLVKGAFLLNYCANGRGCSQ